MNTISTLNALALISMTGVCAYMPVMPARNQQNPCACLEQGLGLPKQKKCYPAAYSAPASISVSCGWDVNVFASFLYWHVEQDDMDAVYVTPGYEGDPGIPTTHGALAGPDFGYQPGFKLGIGFDTSYDDWTGWIEYMWLHQKVSDSVAPPHTIAGSAGSWRENDWFFDFGDSGSPGAAVDTSWKMNLDRLDAMFSRPYYQGTQLTMSPYAGLRALFIRQRYDIHLLAVDGPVYSINQSHSWAIGPVAGTLGHWLLGKGFRFEGLAAASLLYTQYTKISSKVYGNDDTILTAPLYGAVNDVNKLRAIGELGLGMGWGSYLFSQQYFIDFSARYDFMYLWRQNVMRGLVSNFLGYADDIGDLTLHGLTLTGSFDF
jgi:hypothetical protein